MSKKSLAELIELIEEISIEKGMYCKDRSCEINECTVKKKKKERYPQEDDMLCFTVYTAFKLNMPFDDQLIRMDNKVLDYCHVRKCETCEVRKFKKNIKE